MPGIFQLKLRRQQRRPSSADIVRLGKGKGQRIRGDAVDRRLAYRETVRISQAGAHRKAGPIGVHAFHHRGLGVLHIGCAYAHLGAVAQGKVNCGVKRDLGTARRFAPSTVTIPSNTNWQPRLTDILN